MSVGLIKSGEYVPCGASATLMSQYPMATLDSAINITAAMINAGFTAPSAGVLMFFSNNNTSYTISDGHATAMCGTSGSSGTFEANTVLMNKGDVVTSGITVSTFYGTFRPFAVGEVL